MSSVCETTLTRTALNVRRARRVKVQLCCRAWRHVLCAVNE
jgi:hypothetical protein